MRNWGVVGANELAKVTGGWWQKCARSLPKAQGLGSCQSHCLNRPKVPQKVSNKLAEARDTHLIKPLMLMYVIFLIFEN